MYRPLRVLETTLGPTLCYVYTLHICHYAVYEVSVMDGRFQNGTMNVQAHALNLNNQYLTLL